MKEFLKSVNIWGSYGQEFIVLFFDSRCTLHFTLRYIHRDICSSRPHSHCVLRGGLKISWAVLLDDSNCFAPKISMYVCLFVCLSASIYPELHGHSSPNVHAYYLGRGSPLIWWRCDTLRSFGFMDLFYLFKHRRQRARATYMPVKPVQWTYAC